MSDGKKAEEDRGPFKTKIRSSKEMWKIVERNIGRKLKTVKFKDLT